MSSTYIIVTLVSLFLVGNAARYDAVQENRHHRIPDGRIVGGRFARDWEAKYTAFIELSIPNNLFRHCTGSLISWKYVLTAKHCMVNARTGTVSLGSHDITSTSTTDRIELNFNVFDDVTVSSEADLALIKLPPYNLPNGYGFDLVDLPGKSSVHLDYKNETARAYGWGFYSDQPPVVISDRLRVVEVEVTGECGYNYPNEICTSGVGGKGTCGGDSGGPLVIYDKYGRDILIGVTAHGPKLCEAGDPSYYVSMNKYLDWIELNSDAYVPN